MESMLNKKGFTLIEMLIAIAIFSLVMSAVYSALTLQMKHTSREYTVAEADVEVGIAKNIIERDMLMAGYGLAADYGAATSPPFPAPMAPPVKAAQATNGNPDTLTLMGTALGIKNRGAAGWSFFNPNGSFQVWTSDVRERVFPNDRVVAMEPNTQRLLGLGGNWLFSCDPAAGTLTTLAGVSYGTLPPGTVLYGLCTGSSCTAADITQPFYAVRYYIKDNSNSSDPLNCAGPKTGADRVNSLLRAESSKTTAPDSGDPILSCVRDFEVVFGIDTDEKPTLSYGYTMDVWDEGGATYAAGYDNATLNNRLKQIRAYVLLQSGNKDLDYTSPQKIWVGDEGLGTGREVTLTPDQRHYRWRVISMNITPRNIRR